MYIRGLDTTCERGLNMRRMIIALSLMVGIGPVAWGQVDERLGRKADIDHPHLFRPDFKDKQSWEKRAADLREQILVANGLLPLPERTELKAVIHGRIDRDEYTIEKVFFQSMPGHYVTGNLYRPKGKQGKLPAVLCPHGHWTGGRLSERKESEAKREIAAGAEKTMQGAMYHLQARCAMLARMGCVVFFYDMVGYADSFAIPHRHGFTDAQAELRLQTFMGLQTWNSIRALDFVTSLPEVDGSRIAVTGASGGGTQTMILCAIDPRPTVAFPAVMVSANMQGGCICENSSHLRVGTNNIEFAAIFAPKPQGLTGAVDWTRDIETRGQPELKAIYGLYGAQDKVKAWYRSFDHNYNQGSRELMYNWFNQHLSLGHKGTVTEKPFVPAKPAELSVWTADYPKPSDAPDAVALRKKMTETSDAQMRKLASEPAEFRRVVGSALRVMVGPLPSHHEVAIAGDSGWLEKNGVRVQLGYLGRVGARERVPFLAMVPKDWTGRVLIWAHPEGMKGLFPEAKSVLDKGTALVSADLFMTGEHARDGGALVKDAKHAGQTYGGFFYGYNHGVLQNRVRDLLSLIAMTKGWVGTREVNLVGVGAAGPWALLARAAAGDAISKAAIDCNGFDFDQVQAVEAEMMLPGALKYGGLMSFAALCDKTVLFNPPARENAIAAPAASGLTINKDKASLDALLGTFND